MRLTPDQTRIIKAAVAREFEPDARIWLFGSRTHDHKRGGDIDLYVETRHPDLLRELRCKIGAKGADQEPGAGLFRSIKNPLNQPELEIAQPSGASLLGPAIGSAAPKTCGLVGSASPGSFASTCLCPGQHGGSTDGWG